MLASAGQSRRDVSVRRDDCGSSAASVLLTSSETTASSRKGAARWSMRPTEAECPDAYPTRGRLAVYTRTATDKQAGNNRSRRWVGVPGREHAAGLPATSHSTGGIMRATARTVVLVACVIGVRVPPASAAPPRASRSRGSPRSRGATPARRSRRSAVWSRGPRTQPICTTPRARQQTRAERTTRTIQPAPASRRTSSGCRRRTTRWPGSGQRARRGHGRGSDDWVPRPEAQSVVIHFIPPGGTTAGGPTIACADLD